MPQRGPTAKKASSHARSNPFWNSPFAPDIPSLTLQLVDGRGFTAGNFSLEVGNVFLAPFPRPRGKFAKAGDGEIRAWNGGGGSGIWLPHAYPTVGRSQEVFGFQIPRNGVSAEPCITT